MSEKKCADLKKEIAFERRNYAFLKVTPKSYAKRKWL